MWPHEKLLYLQTQKPKHLHTFLTNNSLFKRQINTTFKHEHYKSLDRTIRCKSLQLFSQGLDQKSIRIQNIKNINFSSSNPADHFSDNIFHLTVIESYYFLTYKTNP